MEDFIDTGRRCDSDRGQASEIAGVSADFLVGVNLESDQLKVWALDHESQRMSPNVAGTPLDHTVCHVSPFGALSDTTTLHSWHAASPPERLSLEEPTAYSLEATL